VRALVLVDVCVMKRLPHGSSLQFWHFPVYGENACVLEGRHGGLVGTKSLGEENGPCLLYGYDYGFVFGFMCLLL
jgi:hypothetical protein